MEVIISIVWSFLELLSFFIFVDAFLSRRYTKNECIISFVAVWGIMCIYTCLELGGTLKQIITVCLATGWTFFLFRGSWQRHILIALLSYVFIAIIDTAVSYGVSALLGISFTDLIWRKLLYVFVVTVAKLFEILVAYIIRRLRNSKGSQSIHRKWLLLTILFPLVSFIMIAMIFNGYQGDEDLTQGAFVLSCILAVANIAILYLIRTMEKSAQKETELILLNQQMEIQTKSIVSLEKSYRAQRKASHDFQNQLQTIYELLANNQNDVVQNYIRQLQELQTVGTFHVNSHHPIIDAILSQKHQIATELQIEMPIQVNDLSGINIATNSLVVLLSNLLDNAIEACQRLPDNRSICCSILAEDHLFISIRNTTLPVNIVNGRIETSKTPKEEHGYGLKNIHHILGHLSAEYTFQYEDGWFQFAAEIPNQAK